MVDDIKNTTTNEVLHESDTEKTEGSRPEGIRGAIEAAYDKLEREASEKDKKQDTEKLEGEKKEKHKLPAPDQEAKSKEDVSEKGKEESSEDSKEEKNEAKTDDDIKAPVSWSRKDREIFNTLDRSAKEIIARREAERDKVLQRATTEKAEIERAVKPFAEISEQIKDIARAAKMKPAEFVKALVETDTQARKDPVGFIERFAKANGVDLKILADGDKESAWDKAMHSASTELQMLKAQVAALQEEREHYAQVAQSTQRASIAPGEQAVLEFFQGDKLEALEADPHLLDRVLIEAEIIRKQDPGASPKEVLSEAYENASYASPTLRQAYQKRRAHAQTEQRRQELEAAKRRQGLSSSAPGTQAAKRFDSTRSLIESIYDDLAQR